MFYCQYVNSSISHKIYITTFFFIYFQITFDELQAEFTRLQKPGQDPKYIEKVESYKRRNEGDGEAGATSAKRKTRWSYSTFQKMKIQLKIKALNYNLDTFLCND